MSKSKIDFRHIFIEAILIVFTVFLALALNEWRSSVKENTARDAVLTNIIKEIESNKSDIESKMPYHAAMSEKLRNYLQSDSLWNTLKYNSGMDAVIQILDRGILNPNLQYAAWRSAELSGIANTFEYQTIYVLSNVYRAQEEGPDSSWKELAGLFSDPDSYEPNSAKRLVRMLSLGFGELYSQEKSLITTYNSALKYLKEGTK